ncbi:glycogen synthase GlgA [bacterium]|nr:glycogen synthase GlgA [bacterium]
MEIIIVSSEAVPYVQTGGLGDVVGAFANQLALKNHHVYLIIPFFRNIRQNRSKLKLKICVSALEVKMGDRTFSCRVWKTFPAPNLQVFFIEYNDFFDRNNLYVDGFEEYEDNGERFSFFCKAALDLSLKIKLNPDIIHVNDWQTALIPYYLKTWYWNEPSFKNTASVFTIHNMGYQGRINRSKSSFLGLNWMQMRSEEFEDQGKINLLKGGIFYADVITTVSPTYAKEILTEPGGCGLSNHLSRRTIDVTGILNGIDDQLWNPETDPYIPENFSRKNLFGKTVCKANLQKQFGFEVNPEIPIFGIVSRLAYQKGLQLLMECADDIMQWELQFILLGSGDPSYSEFFQNLAKRYPGKAGVYIGFQTELSHLIEAGSDFSIMPSLYEPCGLNQLYSMLYGTLPIVRATGGLNDTVEKFDEENLTGTGFVFDDISSNALRNTIGWALSTWYDKREAYKKIQLQAMNQDFSWKNPIREYESVYRKAIRRRKDWH